MNGTSVHPERIAELQSRFNLSYHIPSLALADEHVGVRGKAVLEVGGSLPKDLVLREFGARQWIAIEELGYWNELAAPMNPRTSSTSIIGKLTEISDAASLPSYGVLSGAIEDSPAALAGHFDVVVSFAAFEHITDFPSALLGIHRALKPGGRLFSIFSPIWSAHDGHHLPRIKDKTGHAFNFHSSPIPPWGHLLMRPPELYRFLLSQTDPGTASRMVYYVYHSPQINRLFVEDYAAYAFSGPLHVDAFNLTFSATVPTETQIRLQELHPGRKQFANNGIAMICTRSET